MSSKPAVSVSLSQLRDAYEFANFGGGYENRAYLCLDTGRIFLKSELVEMDDDIPDDLDESDRLVGIPRQNDLDLGARMVKSFVAEELPDDYDTVVDYFHRRGAYRRFRALIERRGALDRWHAFRDAATDRALHAWCEEVGVLLLDGPGREEPADEKSG